MKQPKKYVVVKVPKKFNWLAFIILSFLFNIFGLVGYIIYYNVRGPLRELLVEEGKLK